MKKLILILFVTLSFGFAVFSQAPGYFNYQTVIHNSTGEVIANTEINFRISILQGSSSGDPVFSETQLINSNDFGVCNLKIGKGDNITGSIPAIEWNSGEYYLQIEIDDTGGESFTTVGIVQLVSVPYSLYSTNSYISNSSVYADTAQYSIHSDTANFAKKLDEDVLYFTNTDTLFAVKDREGHIVFAVFPDGAKVYVNESSKGTVGGFAVTGRNPTKEGEYNVFTVTPDSTRIWINETITKRGVGGFAVTGRNPTKETIGDYMLVTGDSTRIYVKDTVYNKGSVGGFAVTGRNPTKGEDSRLMDITRENYFIGHEAGKSNTYGIYNSFMGYKAGYSNTVGNRNTFLGYYSGFTNTEGYSNIFIGDSAGFYNILIKAAFIIFLFN